MRPSVRGNAFVLVGFLSAACGTSEPAARTSTPAATPTPAAAPTPRELGQKYLPPNAYQVKWVALDVPARLRPAQHAAARVTIENSSPVAWPGGAGTGGLMYTVRLSHRWLRDGRVAVDYGDRRAELPTVVAPGASVTVDVQLTAPQAPGTYAVQFDLVHEGVAFFEGMGVPAQRVEVAVGG